jgi:hypothetical protein
MTLLQAILLHFVVLISSLQECFILYRFEMLHTHLLRAGIYLFTHICVCILLFVLAHS